MGAIAAAPAAIAGGAGLLSTAFGGGNPISGAGKMIKKGPMGALQDVVYPEDQAPPPQQIDPQLKAIQEAQAKNAKDFRTNLPSLQSQGQAQIQNNAGLDLNAKNEAITRASSKRGLLYSGIREGEQSKAGAQSANDVSQKTTDLNTTLNNQANQMDNQALMSGVQMGNLQAQLNMNAYNMALEQRRNKNAVTDASLGAFGQMFGIFGGGGGGG